MRSRKRKLCSLKGGARWIYFNRAGNFSSFFFYADLQCCDIGDDDWSSTRYVINARPFRIERKGSRVTPLSTAAIKIEIPSRGSGLHYSFQSLFGHPLIPLQRAIIPFAIRDALIRAFLYNYIRTRILTRRLSGPVRKAIIVAR